MFITAEILKKYKACDQGVRYVERFYPNGVEMIDIIRDRHINKEFLHWGREHLIVTEEDQEAYREACKIVNTEGYWYSVDVRDSQYVVKSKSVNESRSVFESSEIEKSADIVNSDNVNDSSQIFYSSMIDTCQKIFKSKNIVESINVCNSTMVARSKSIIDSFNVFDSSEIVNCQSVSDSHFCKDCKNIKFCMFCEGIEDAEYCIFNQPVDKMHYDVFIKQYKKYLTELLDFIREWPCDLIKGVFNPPTRKFDAWYYPISEKFWKWVKTIPGYDSMFIYNMTMLPELLLD